MSLKYQQDLLELLKKTNGWKHMNKKRIEIFQDLYGTLNHNSHASKPH